MLLIGTDIWFAALFLRIPYFDYDWLLYFLLASIKIQLTQRFWTTSKREFLSTGIIWRIVGEVILCIMDSMRVDRSLFYFFTHMLWSLIQILDRRRGWLSSFNASLAFLIFFQHYFCFNFAVSVDCFKNLGDGFLVSLLNMSLFEIEDSFPALMAVVYLIKMAKRNNPILFGSHKNQWARNILNLFAKIKLGNFKSDFLMDFWFQVIQE